MVQENTSKRLCCILQIINNSPKDICCTGADWLKCKELKLTTIDNAAGLSYVLTKQSSFNIIHIGSYMSCHLINLYLFFWYFFSVQLVLVLHGHSLFSSPPQRPMTSHFEGFYIPDFIHYIYFPILILEKDPVFSLLNVQC